MITIYLVLFIIMLAFVVYSTKKKLIIEQRFLAISCLLWALVFGLRGNTVGNDTPSYAGFFNGKGGGYGTVDFPEESLEHIFVFLSKMLTSISNSETFVFCILSFLQFLIIYKLYILRGKYALWGLLVFFTIGENWGPLMVAVRQSVSITVTLIGLYFFHMFVEKWKLRKSFKYLEFWISLLILILSCTIHRVSSITTIILVSLMFIRLNKVVSIISIVASFVLAVSFSGIIGEVVDYFLRYLSFSSDENFIILGDRYNKTFGMTSMSLSRMLLLSSATILTCYLTNYQKVNKFFINCLVVSVCIMLVFSQSYMVTRLNCIFLLIGCTVFIPHIVRKNHLLYMLYLSFTLICVLRLYFFFGHWPKSDSMIPYYFFWEQL